MNPWDKDPVAHPWETDPVQKAGPQPSIMDRIVASPLGRTVEESIVAPVTQTLGSVFDAYRTPIQQAMGGGTPTPVAQTVSSTYQGALARNRNTPGYAAARTQADAIAGQGGMPSRALGPLLPGLGGIAGLLTGGLDQSNASADAFTQQRDQFRKDHPILAPALETVALSGMPENRLRSLDALPQVQSDKGIVSSFYKAVKPTTAGKATVGQTEKFNSNVVSATKAIAENQPALEFDGETGRLPQNRMELVDAIGQTKKTIFNKYDALAQQTGDQGITVPLTKAGDALDKVINNEALQIRNPQAISEAKSLQSRLMNPDGTYKQLSPQVVQDMVTGYNADLKSFYRNPSYDSASKAAIDAGVAHQLREALDEAISKATGAQYQELKNQYGALSAVEKDANKAAVAAMKQTGSNASGFGKYIDIISGGDIASGLLTLPFHPPAGVAMIMKGLLQSAGNHYFQWLNSPDRAVGKMMMATHGLPPAVAQTQINALLSQIAAKKAVPYGATIPMLQYAQPQPSR